MLDEKRDLPVPPVPVETPCFVILEDEVVFNLRQTARLAGGIGRLMPHVKTHRAPWIIEMMIREGVLGFKTATPAEVEIAAEAGARLIVWAYPTANQANIRRVANVARSHDGLRIEAVVDSYEGLHAWQSELASGAGNVGFRVDLDPGLGRTGVPIDEGAIALARAMAVAGHFAGWHVYDGHITDADRAEREVKLARLINAVRKLMADVSAAGLSTDLIAAGSYSFNIWSAEVARWVSTGSFTFSSAQHSSDLGDIGWRIAAYVLSTVVSVGRDTATLDAGSKAVSPDIPVTSRFVGPGPIKMIKEEHAVIGTNSLRVGDYVALTPRHACTAAYLYNRALVRTTAGKWEYRTQLGANR